MKDRRETKEVVLIRRVWVKEVCQIVGPRRVDNMSSQLLEQICLNVALKELV